MFVPNNRKLQKCSEAKQSKYRIMLAKNEKHQNALQICWRKYFNGRIKPFLFRN